MNEDICIRYGRMDEIATKRTLLVCLKYVKKLTYISLHLWAEYTLNMEENVSLVTLQALSKINAVNN